METDLGWTSLAMMSSESMVSSTNVLYKGLSTLLSVNNKRYSTLSVSVYARNCESSTAKLSITVFAVTYRPKDSVAKHVKFRTQVKPSMASSSPQITLLDLSYGPFTGGLYSVVFLLVSLHISHTFYKR